MTPRALKLYLSVPASNSFLIAAIAPAFSLFEKIRFQKIDSEKDDPPNFLVMSLSLSNALAPSGFLSASIKQVAKTYKNLHLQSESESSLSSSKFDTFSTMAVRFLAHPGINSPQMIVQVVMEAL